MKHPKNELFAVASGDRFIPIDIKGSRFPRQEFTTSKEAAERTADKQMNRSDVREVHIYRLTPVKSYTTTVHVEEHEDE